MMIAHGSRAVLISPDGKEVEFQEQDGLLKPCIQQHVAYKTVQVKHNKVTPDMKKMLGVLVCMAVLEYMMHVPSMSGDMVKYGMPLLSMLQMSLDSNSVPKTVPVAHAPKRHKHTKLSPLEHARQGHVPHDDSCEVCRMARMRAPMARESEGEVIDADKGYVLGVDYVGPFEPDVCGNVYALVGVEVGHTNYGSLERHNTACRF